MESGAFATGFVQSSDITDLLMAEIMLLRTRLTVSEQHSMQLEECIVRLNEEIHDLRAENQDLRVKQFISKSERNKKLPKGADADGSQLVLDLGDSDEAGGADAEAAEKPDVDNDVIVVQYKRRRSTKRTAGRSLAELLQHMEPEEVIDVDVGAMFCALCGSEMSVLGYQSFLELVVVPARAYAREIRVPTHVCRNCDETGIEVPIVHSNLPIERPIMRCMASAETIALLIYQKVVMAMPLHRLSDFLKDVGAPISKATLTNWMIAAAFRFLLPLVLCIRAKLLEQSVIHADETPFQVLHEKGRSAEQKSYMWIYCSTYGAEARYIVVEYSASRAAACAGRFLAGFAGFIHCDGYAAYERLEKEELKIFRSGCWAHTRRLWFAAARKAGNQSAANRGYWYVEMLFEAEEMFVGMTPEERFLARLEKVLPLLRCFRKWLEKQYTGKTLVGKAVQYTLNQWPALMNYLGDGRLQATNAAAELIARSVAVGRKNFMFSDSVDGARALAAAYSVTQTAAAQNVNVYQYLTWVLSAGALATAFAEQSCEPALQMLAALEKNEMSGLRPFLKEEIRTRPPSLGSPCEMLRLAENAIREQHIEPIRQYLADEILLHARACVMREYLPEYMPKDWDPHRIGLDLPHQRR